jgi:hypothetical protein
MMKLDKNAIYNKILDNPITQQYLEKNICCRSIQLDPMFENVDEYDFKKPIKLLEDYYHQVQYYSNLCDKVAHITNIKAEMLNLVDFHPELDEVLLQYVKCRENIRVCVTYDNNTLNKIDKSQITAIKKLKVNNKQLLGFLYLLQIYEKGVARPIDLLLKERNLILNGLKEIDLYIIFSETEMIKKYKLEDLIYNTSEFMLVVEVAQMVCNKNCFRLFQHQRLDRILNEDFSHSPVLLMTIKKWLYKNIKLVDHMRFMIFSGSVLYTLGIRNLSDLDMILMNMGEKKTEHFNELIYKFFVDKETRFDFLDFHIKETDGTWYLSGEQIPYLNEWFDLEWPMMYGAESMIETVFNPKYHYYYFGLKIQHMEADIKRRIKRTRPAAFADLIAIEHYTGEKIEIPPLDKGYWKDHVYYEFNDKELKKLVNTTKFHLRNKFRINKNDDEIKKFIGIF